MAAPVFLEVGRKRVFACALDWPGWCRSGKSDEEALAALAAYAERYSVVARTAGVPFPAVTSDDFEIVERRPGGTTTDFGAPGEAAEADRASLAAVEAGRMTALVEASWNIFDRIAAASPAELRKGPRGGGRDRDKLIDHVLAAETAYARKLGIKQRQPVHGDAADIAALRAAIGAALRDHRGDEPVVPKGWLPRYAARRIAWHVLDHAWEMEDRVDAGPDSAR